VVACLSSIDVFTSAGTVSVLAGDGERMTKVAHALAECGSARLVPTGQDLLLVLGGCPTMEVYRSSDVATWRHVATLDGAALGHAGEDDGGIQLWAATPDDDLVHLVAIAEYLLPVPACQCYDAHIVHAVIDPRSGLVLATQDLKRELNNQARFDFELASGPGVVLLVSPDLRAGLQEVRAAS
jgi:hypothetical protein